MIDNESAVPGVLTPMNFEIMSEETRPPRKKMQIIAALIISMSTLSASATLAVSLDFSHQLTEAITSFPFNMTEISLLYTLLIFGGFVGILIATFLMDKVGRRIILITINVPFTSSWILLLASKHPLVVIFGRLLAGIAIGVVRLVAPVYLFEIVDPTIRGAIITLFPLFIAFGDLTIVFLGFDAMTYKILIIFFCFLSVSQIVLLLWIPDSPYYLLKQNRLSDAAKSLKWFWGNQCNVHNTLETIQTDLEHTSGSIKSLIKNLFHRKENWKSLIICLLMMCFLQVFFYFNTKIYLIVSNKIYISPILYLSFSFILIFVIFLVSALIDRIGRRKLLSLSCTLMGLSYVALKSYFAYYVEPDEGVDEFLDWFPPTLFCIMYTIGFGIGINPIAWVIMVELFSIDVKRIGAAIVVLCNWILAGLMTIYITELLTFKQENVDNIIFLISIILLALLIKKLPETKGKTNTEIKTSLAALNLFKL